MALAFDPSVPGGFRERATLEHFQEKWKSGFPSENATMQESRAPTAAPARRACCIDREFVAIADGRLHCFSVC
jgi:hypothetical protein